LSGWVVISHADGVFDLRFNGTPFQFAQVTPTTLKYCLASDCLEAAVTLNAGFIHHIAIVWDGTDRILYANDVEVGRDTPANTQQSGSGTTKYTITADDGLIDDMRVYRRALNAREIGELYGMAWRSAALTTRSNEFGSWTSSVPDGLEGIYELKTLGVDNLLNVGEDVGVDAWRGVVDTVAPRVTYTRTTSAPFQYEFDATDFNLNSASFMMPQACEGNTIITEVPYASPWYLALQLQQSEMPSRTHRFIATCTLTTPLTPTDIFHICDITGGCTAVNAEGTAVPTAVGLGAFSSTPASAVGILVMLLILLVISVAVALSKYRRRVY
jgi:hypothetical protein